MSRHGEGPVRAPWSRRIDWSAERGLSRAIPPRIVRMTVDAPDIDGVAAFARDAAAVARVEHVQVRITAWRAPTPGWVGRLGPITGVARSEIRVPYIGPARVVVRVDLNNPRPVREVLGAVLDVLVPGAPMPYPQTATVGSNGSVPKWLPVGADAANHFLGSATTFAADGSPVDVVSGIKRNPDNPPPNRPAADAEIVMPGEAPAASASRPSPRWPSRTTTSSSRALRQPVVLLDVRGRPVRRWRPPLDGDAQGRLELQVIDGWTRWRLTRPATREGSLPSVPTEPPGQWLGLEAPIPASMGPDPFPWWSLDCHVAEDVPPAAAARLVLRVALSGIVLDGRALPAAVRDQLCAELADLLSEPLPPAGADPLVWETRSVRQRRAVVRGHATDPCRARPGACRVRRGGRAADGDGAARDASTAARRPGPADAARPDLPPPRHHHRPARRRQRARAGPGGRRLLGPGRGA